MSAFDDDEADGKFDGTRARGEHRRPHHRAPRPTPAPVAAGPSCLNAGDHRFVDGYQGCQVCGVTRAVARKQHRTGARPVGRPPRARPALSFGVQLDVELVALAKRRAADLGRSFNGHLAALIAADLGKRPEAFGHDV